MERREEVKRGLKVGVRVENVQDLDRITIMKIVTGGLNPTDSK